MEKTSNGRPDGDSDQTTGAGEKQNAGTQKPADQSQKKPSKIKQLWEKSGLDVYVLFR